MKKITLLHLAILCFAFIGKAQITKGSTFLGGSGSFSSNTQTDASSQTSKNKSWHLSPQVGKVIRTNRVAGIFASIAHTSTKADNNVLINRTESNNIGGGVFYRRYFPLGTRWYLFGNGSLGVFSSTGTNKSNGILSFKGTGWSTGISLSPGVTFAATKRLYIETGLNNLFDINYASSKNRSYNGSGNVINTYKSRQASANVNLSGFSDFNFGLRWILPSKDPKS